MEKEFVPYEQALDLKELGFDEPCMAYYRKNNSTLKFGEGFELVTREPYRNVMRYPLVNSRYEAGNNAPDGYYYLTTSPTFSQAFRWFREKYGLIGYIQTSYITHEVINNKNIPCTPRIEFTFGITNTIGKSIFSSFKQGSFKTHEEAELECLKKLIEIVKQLNKQTMKKLVVIDHSTQEVVVYPYDENIWDCPEDYTDEDGIYVIDSNCSWIVVDELNIKII